MIVFFIDNVNYHTSSLDYKCGCLQGDSADYQISTIVLEIEVSDIRTRSKLMFYKYIYQYQLLYKHKANIFAYADNITKTSMSNVMIIR